MASNIDITKPVSGEATTASVRSNFSTAKDEIEALQAKTTNLDSSGNFSGGSVSSLSAALAVADGGTGATTSSGARTNLGLVIGTDVQAYDATLADIAAQTPTANSLIYFGGGAAAAVTGLTSFGRSLIDDNNASTARATLGAQAQDAVLDDLAGLTLAQGDVLYYNGTNLVNLGAGTSGQALVTQGAGANPTWADRRKLVQRVIATNTTKFGITTQIPLDNTIPQNTEGDEIITRSITPTNASNRLLIRFACSGLVTGLGTGCVVALFKDSDANAIESQYFSINPVMGGLVHERAAGGTSAITFKIRGGPAAASATLRINADSAGNSLFNLTMRTSLIVEECES